MPKIVEEFLEIVELEADYIFGITTYGSIKVGITDTFIHMLRKKGHAPSYVTSVKMIDNYLKAFNMKEEKSKYNDVLIKECIDDIKRDILAKKKMILKPSIIKGLLSGIGRKIYLRSNKEFGENFTVEAHCNGCGICVKVCPMDNITIDRQPQFGDH